MTTLKTNSVHSTTLKQWLEKEDVVIIDVREAREFASEHIPGAQLMPLSSFKPSNLPRTKKIVIYCQSGIRSDKAMRIIPKDVQASALTGGLIAWKKAGYVTNSKPGAPISIMRQGQILTGSLVLLSTYLAIEFNPWFLLIAGLVSIGLIFAGITNTCGMTLFLSRLPYNRRSPCSCNATSCASCQNG